MADSHSTSARKTLNARFRRSIIRDLSLEVRILTRINPKLGMQAERSLIEMGG